MRLADLWRSASLFMLKEVMHGNVGTEERLDFAVIGRAVNEAARLQGLTKQQGHPVLASASFIEPIRGRFEFVGAYSVAGFDEMFETYIPCTWCICLTFRAF